MTYTCDICSSTFTFNSNLRRHKRVVHKHMGTLETRKTSILKTGDELKERHASYQAKSYRLNKERILLNAFKKKAIKDFRERIEHPERRIPPEPEEPKEPEGNLFVFAKKYVPELNHLVVGSTAWLKCARIKLHPDKTRNEVSLLHL